MSDLPPGRLAPVAPLSTDLFDEDSGPLPNVSIETVPTMPSESDETGASRYRDLGGAVAAEALRLLRLADDMDRKMNDEPKATIRSPPPSGRRLSPKPPLPHTPPAASSPVRDPSPLSASTLQAGAGTGGAAVLPAGQEPPPPPATVEGAPPPPVEVTSIPNTEEPPRNAAAPPQQSVAPPPNLTTTDAVPTPRPTPTPSSGVTPPPPRRLSGASPRRLPSPSFRPRPPPPRLRRSPSPCRGPSPERRLVDAHSGVAFSSFFTAPSITSRRGASTSFAGSSHSPAPGHFFSRRVNPPSPPAYSPVVTPPPGSPLSRPLCSPAGSHLSSPARWAAPTDGPVVSPPRSGPRFVVEPRGRVLRVAAAVSALGLLALVAELPVARPCLLLLSGCSAAAAAVAGARAADPPPAWVPSLWPTRCGPGSGAVSAASVAVASFAAAAELPLGRYALWFLCGLAAVAGGVSVAPVVSPARSRFQSPRRFGHAGGVSGAVVCFTAAACCTAGTAVYPPLGVFCTSTCIACFWLWAVNLSRSTWVSAAVFGLACAAAAVSCGLVGTREGRVGGVVVLSCCCSAQAFVSLKALRHGRHLMIGVGGQGAADGATVVAHCVAAAYGLCEAIDLGRGGAGGRAALLFFSAAVSALSAGSIVTAGTSMPSVLSLRRRWGILPQAWFAVVFCAVIGATTDMVCSSLRCEDLSLSSISLPLGV
eukprot:Hpha_TRINITY_DN5135_c0_g1::TRINITY_DN5135_c0_g1_i1::g.192877::m.192877